MGEKGRLEEEMVGWMRDGDGKGVERVSQRHWRPQPLHAVQHSHVGREKEREGEARGEAVETLQQGMEGVV